MICKYCGARIDTVRMICDRCGRAAAGEAGNGFWDLQEVPIQETSYLESTRREESQREERGMTGTRQKGFSCKSVGDAPKAIAGWSSKLPFLLCAAILSLFMVGLLLSGVSHRRSLRELERYYQVQIEEQSISHQAQLDEMNRELEARNLELETLREALRQQEERTMSKGSNVGDDPYMGEDQEADDFQNASEARIVGEDPAVKDAQPDCWIEEQLGRSRVGETEGVKTPFPYSADPVWPDPVQTHS